MKQKTMSSRDYDRGEPQSQRSPRAIAGAGLVLLTVLHGTVLAQPALRIEQASYQISGSTATIGIDFCNDSNGGSSGTLLYELALRNPTSQVKYTLGSEQGDLIEGGYCRRGVVKVFSISLNVPDGLYEVVLILGSFDGSSFVERDRLTFDNMLQIGGGPPPTECPYRNDGECDDGSPGAVTDLCAPGTDPEDCGGPIEDRRLKGGGGSGAAAPCGAGAMGAFLFSFSGLAAMQRRRRLHSSRIGATGKNCSP